ncbi:MAG: Wzz/FepE/Etk N-terminal domain-containing protein [bacterium]|nr:Wzz/FepE/Etk N-terminal domain-containing protein [bacterium]MDD5755716.1 Wzz/FepE/Etk N-terminal domain-containing protein [bacterium]
MEDKKELGYYFYMLWHNKITIMAITLAFILVGIVLGKTVLSPVYETDFKIRIGSFNDNKEVTRDNIVFFKVNLVSKEEFANSIRNPEIQGLMQRATGKDISLNEIERIIKVELMDKSDIARILIRYPQSKAALKIAEDIAAKIIDDHKSIFAKRIQIYDQYRTDLQKYIMENEKEMAALQKRMIALQSDSQADSIRLMFLSDSVAEKKATIVKMKKELSQVEILADQAESTKILSYPVKPRIPVKFNRSANITVAAIVGFLLAVILVLLKDYLVTYSKKS